MLNCNLYRIAMIATQGSLIFAGLLEGSGYDILAWTTFFLAPILAALFVYHFCSPYPLQIVGLSNLRFSLPVPTLVC
jgi:hypothetical protein